MEKLADNLRCPICMEIFEEPKQLPCGHTLCLECINKQVQHGQLRCPMDRKETTVPVDGFPPSVTIIGILDALCSSCRSGLPTMDCSHCSEKLCPDCASEHQTLVYKEATKSLDQLHDVIDKAKDWIRRADPMNHEIFNDIKELETQMYDKVRDTIQTLTETANRMLKVDVEDYEKRKKDLETEISSAQAQLDAATAELGTDHQPTIILGEIIQLQEKCQATRHHLQTEIPPDVAELFLIHECNIQARIEAPGDVMLVDDIGRLAEEVQTCDVGRREQLGSQHLPPILSQLAHHTELDLDALEVNWCACNVLLYNSKRNVKLFIGYDGVRRACKHIQKYQDEQKILHKVLLTLCNVSNDHPKELLPHLDQLLGLATHQVQQPDQHELLQAILAILHRVSKNHPQELLPHLDQLLMLAACKVQYISYRCCLVLARILYYTSPSCWQQPTDDRKAALSSRLVDALDGLNVYIDMLIIKVSFADEKAYLDSDQQVLQYFSAWNMAYILTQDAARYSPLIERDVGVDYIKSLSQKMESQPDIHKLLQKAIDLMKPL